MYRPENEDTMTLSDLRVNDVFKIKRVSLGGEIGKRMVEMGLFKGTVGKVVRKAPLGDPLEVSILGYELSLRKAEAKGILVEKIENFVET